MTVTNYYTVNGSIIGESTNGVRTDYLMDALGSVTGTVNSSAQVINTYRYKPFGDLLSKSGTGADPAFGWVGTQGYKQTQKKFSNFYVRARHYGSSQGRWTTVDPLWPKESAYTYSNTNVITQIDFSGMEPTPPKISPPKPPKPGDPIDSKTGCYCTPRTNCSGQTNRHQAYLDIKKMLEDELKCVANPAKGKKYSQILAIAMTCLAEAESSLDHSCYSNFRRDHDSRCDLFGLFQIDRTRFYNCSSQTGDFCNIQSQISTAVKMVTSYCNGSSNLLEAMRQYWGPTQSSDPNYTKWIKCLKDHSISLGELKGISCNAMKNCPKCDNNPRKESKYDCP